MPNAPDQLPDDIDALKALVVEQAARVTRLEEKNVHLDAKVFSLQEQLNLALARRYAASSEKLSPDQIYLFDEAEAVASTDDTAELDETVEVPAHTRKKRGRKPLPKSLPRVDIVHEIAAEHRHCPHDDRLLAEIGDVVSEQLDIVPAKIQVIRHIRSNMPVIAVSVSRQRRYQPNPSPKAWLRRDCWRISLYPNTRMPCHCTGRRPS